MFDRIVPGPGARPRTTDAAVSSQLVSMPRTVRSCNRNSASAPARNAVWSPPFSKIDPDTPMLRIGTRGSKLALVQANMVAGLVGVPTEIVILKTSGDRIQDRSLADVGGKGLFVKELEDALLSERIDLAVHSMKDVPVDLPEGLEIAALLPREDPRDAFISHRAASLAEMPQGAV